MKIGNEDAKLYLGGSEVDKIYLGTEQVYGGSPATPKWIATYVSGTTSSAECDSSSAIYSGDIDSTNLTDVVIGDCVTSIGSWAFNGCSSLTSITIGSSVTSIGGSAFAYCSSLTSVTMPNSVTSISNSAFESCGSLTSVTIGSGVTSIGEVAFGFCNSLTRITIYATTPPTLGEYVFEGTNDCPIYVPSASVNAYKTASGWSDYASRIEAIPQPFSGKWLATYQGGVTSSAECDSSSAITKGEITLTNLTDVVIGDCVTSIGTSAFTNCSSLTSATIPNSVTSIGEYAFRDCSSLTSVTIPSGVTSIGNYAFNRCRGLRGVTIGSGVTYIGTYAFYNCSGLTSVIIYATTPPTLNSTAFYRTNDCPIYVPSASVAAYQSASGWSSLASRIQAIQ